MAKRAYGTYDIAEICNVTPATVGNWVEKGLIPTFKTGGGHRRVWLEDLLTFLKEHNIPVPQDLKLGSKGKILIVDDEEAIRNVIRRALQDSHPEARIEEAVDGFEAGQKISRLIPSVVVLDIRLPGMDGLRVCKSIRADPALRHIKILAISGHNPDQSRQDSLSAGADDFLAKPFDIQDLKNRVARLIGSSNGKISGEIKP